MNEYTKIPLISFVLVLAITSVGIQAQQEEVKYGGGPIVLLGSGPFLANRSYKIDLLGLLDANGTSPLIQTNSTFNLMSFNGTHLTFMLKKSSPVIRLDPNLGFSFLPPFLITLSNGVISEVSMESESNHTGELEIIEARVGGNARVHLDGEFLEGPWVNELDGWLLLRNWSSYGELSALLLFQNMTQIYFIGVDRVGSDRCTIEGLTPLYQRVEIHADDGKVEVEARGKPIETRMTDELVLEEGFYVYLSGSDKFLVEVRSSNETSYYNKIDPNSCNRCKLDGISYAFDSEFKLELGVQTPREVVGGSSFQIKLLPPRNYLEVILLFENTLIVVKNIYFPVKIDLRAPISETDYNGSFLITVVSPEGIFGKKVDVRILPGYRLSLLNSSRIYLLGGRGSLTFRIYNFRNDIAFITGMRADLLSNKSSPILLKQPVYEQIPPNSSKTVSLSLDLPLGDYEGRIMINLSDSSGKIYTLSTDENLKIKSVGSIPLSISAFVVPDNPNLGDEVRVFVSVSTAVPLDRLLVNISSAGMDPLSDTSKLLIDVEEGEIVRMEFSLRAKAVGSSPVEISAYYLPRGYTNYMLVSKEFPISIGQLSGRVHAEVNETVISVGERVEVSVTLEGFAGEVTLEFPKGVQIIESQGKLIGNKLKVTSPARVKLIITFNSTGIFTIPTIATINGTRILQLDPAEVRVLGMVSEREKELRSKLADLTRRYKTLVETLRISDQKSLNEIERMLEQAEKLLSDEKYSEAEETLKSIEKAIAEYEERTYNLMAELLNFLIYFVIGAGLAIFLLTFRKLRRRSSPWK